MLHPSYTDLMEAVNEEAVENSDHPVVQSRYSIVLATAKRARQIIAGARPNPTTVKNNKPLSIAVDEIYNKKVKILSDDVEEEAAGEEVFIAEEPEVTDIADITDEAEETEETADNTVE